MVRQLQASNGTVIPRTICLVGYCGRFPPIYVQLLRQDHPELGFVEYPDISAMLSAGLPDDCTLVLADETQCRAAIAHADAMSNLTARMRVAMTFSGPHVDLNCLRECLRHNVVDSFLPMDSRIEPWLCAVSLLLQGGRYVPATLVDELLLSESGGAMNGARRSDSQDLRELTRREMEVLGMVAQGHQNKNIAAELSLSENTIKQHLHHIITKLEVSNRTEAAACYHVHMAALRMRGETHA